MTTKTDQENEIIFKLCGQHLHNKATPSRYYGDTVQGTSQFNTTKRDKFIMFLSETEREIVKMNDTLKLRPEIQTDNKLLNIKHINDFSHSMNPPS